LFLHSNENKPWWWRPHQKLNFGDELAKVVIEKILEKEVQRGNLEKKSEKLLFSVGSVLNFARDGDVVWGSGSRSHNLIFPKNLDIRAVRGPLTRNLLLKQGIACPEIYGDPALLLPLLFPEYKKAQNPSFDYIIIPNIGEISAFKNYKNVVNPTEDYKTVVQYILRSKLVISSSLHGIIVAEAFGVPARLLKMTRMEPFWKYLDYYESTGRKSFTYATSVQSALQMGGEEPGYMDIQPLLKAFPYDFFD
jgi:pyruvyltransferase